MASLKEIKNRSNAIGATRKITKAMQLVATQKLQLTRRHLTSVHFYGDSVKAFFEDLMASIDDPSKLIPRALNQGNLHILMMSDIGLCGGYNNNLARNFEASFDQQKDQVIAVGARALSLLNNLKIKPLLEFSHVGDAPAYDFAASIAKTALPLYITGQVSSISVHYTRFINTISVEATQQKLLPLISNKARPSALQALTEFEPDAATVLRNALPLYLAALIYEKLMEAKVAEHAARRMAMEGATDNATELIDGLTILYNRVRQGRITQEISEIVAGAEAS